VRERIEVAAREAGRDPASVLLVAAAKTMSVPAIASVAGAGVLDIGENRGQELCEKAAAPALAGIRWHMIGRIQTNKVRALAAHVTLWQSVDRRSVVDELARRAPGAAILVQVNTGREPTKGGCDPADAAGLVGFASSRGLEVRGLMCIPPAGGEPVSHFGALRALADDLDLPECSMGMSADFEAAIRAGATIVRIGAAIFGQRPPGPGDR
jgi:hypothetical protein